MFKTRRFDQKLSHFYLGVQNAIQRRNLSLRRAGMLGYPERAIGIARILIFTKSLKRLAANIRRSYSTYIAPSDAER